MPIRSLSAPLLTCLLALFSCLPVARAKPPAVAPEELRTAAGKRVWVYLPKGTASSKTKLACVLIPPAGSRLFHGMSLGEGDQPEHLPWVAAGFAVVAFDLSGPVPEQMDTDAPLLKGAEEFRKARFGVDDGLAALDAALAKYPQLDPARLYVAGHSSAGTLSLQLAAAGKERFAGCVAFAPIANLGEHLKEALPSLDAALPGYAEALRQASPSAQVDAFACPVFLFHAKDDGNVSTAEITPFKDALLARGKTVEFVEVPNGGHYESMVEQGIPKAIAWVKKLGQKQPKK